MPQKEDASKGGGETGKCVEGMISDVDANRTGEAVNLSIGPPQSQDSHEAVANPPDAGSSELPLSPEDIRSFEENGFVMLKRAFDPDVAAACRQGRKTSNENWCHSNISVRCTFGTGAVVNVRSNR